MAKEGYGSVLELMQADVATQGTLRAMFLDAAALEVRRSIYDDSWDDNAASRAEREKAQGRRQF